MGRKARTAAKHLKVKNPIGKKGYEFFQEKPLSDIIEFRDHRRLSVFFHKGFECANPSCNKVGTRLICGLDFGGSKHWDVYTDDLLMMTVDHIIPKAKNGSEDLSNKQPMCSSCNTLKGDKYDLKKAAEEIGLTLL